MLFFTFYFHFSCFSIPLFGIFEGFPLISFIHVLIIHLFSLFRIFHYPIKCFMTSYALFIFNLLIRIISKTLAGYGK